jgi:hypothetical protein
MPAKTLSVLPKAADAAKTIGMTIGWKAVDDFRSSRKCENAKAWRELHKGDPRHKFIKFKAPDGAINCYEA